MKQLISKKSEEGGSSTRKEESRSRGDVADRERFKKPFEIERKPWVGDQQIIIPSGHLCSSVSTGSEKATSPWWMTPEVVLSRSK